MKTLNENSLVSNKNRDFYLDNVKCALMFLVVFGHFLTSIHGSGVAIGIKYMVYSFHMPLFVFVSGYLAKSIYRDDGFRYNKIITIMWCYFLYRILVALLQTLFTGNKTQIIDFFSEDGAGWYLFTLVIWYLMIPFMKNIKASYALFFSIIIALLVGYEKSVGNIFCLSRILVFGPYFYLGYYMNSEMLRKIVNCKFKWCIIILSCIIAIGIIFKYEYFENYLYLIYGNKNYFTLGEEWLYGPLVRIALNCITVVFSLALLFLVPQKKTFLSVIGQRTLTIYILHILIRNIMRYLGAFDAIDFGDYTFLKLLLLIIFSILLTALLALKPIDQLFNKIFKIAIPSRIYNK